MGFAASGLLLYVVAPVGNRDVTSRYAVTAGLLFVAAFAIGFDAYDKPGVLIEVLAAGTPRSGLEPAHTLPEPEPDPRFPRASYVPHFQPPATGSDGQRPANISVAAALLTCSFPVVLVGLEGIEPSTSSLSAMRSNRLSYSPMPRARSAPGVRRG
jgi:hypothetical protein